MIDRIIETFTSEREGNDTWLRYRLTLGYDWDELTLCLSENHNGWNGKIKEERSFAIDSLTGEELVNKIKDYVSDFAEDEEQEQEVLMRIQYLLEEKHSITIKLHEN